MSSDKITGHCGGFICSYADGQRIIEVGFVTSSGNLVTIPRDVFDRAAEWIREKETDDFEVRSIVLETMPDDPGAPS